MDPPEISVDPNKSSPPSLSALGSGKICIATVYELMEKTYYAVFIVDLASPSILPSVGGDTGFIPSAPTILLDLDFDSRDANYYTVSLFNSTLYLFEKGLYALYGPRKWKSVFSYDLSPHLDRKEDQPAPPAVVTKSMLTPSPDMLSPKNCPLAIPTPDGKRILLLSAQFCYDPGYINTAEIGSVDFELFNPADEKEPWKKLPSLHEFLEKIGARGADFFLDSYRFITDSIFLIRFKFGIFTIDIDEKLVPVWKKIGGRDIDVPFNGPVFGIKDDDMLLLTTSCAYEMSNGCGGDDMFRPISSPIRSSIGEDFEIGENLWSDLNTIYDKHRRLIGFVILQLATDKNDYPHMFLDVYDFNLHKYRNDKKIVGKDAAHLEPSLIKSFKFIINGEKCSVFSPLCVSSIYFENGKL